MALQRLAQGLALEVADVAGETVVHLVLQLLAGHRDLLGIDHHQVVAGVDVRGVDGLVLAAQAVGQLGGQAAEGLAGGVDEIPVALDGLGLGDVSLHGELGWLVGLVRPRMARVERRHAL